jgi:hypothetical protein
VPFAYLLHVTKQPKLLGLSLSCLPRMSTSV